MATCPDGHDCADDAKFCSECGAAMVAISPSGPPLPPQPAAASETPEKSSASSQVIDRDALGVLTKVGQGGQGVVYSAPKVTTTFASSMVLKEYKPQVLGGIDFTVLAAMPALVEDSLTYIEAERLISIAAWPCRIVQDGGTPTGFVMPSIPEAFYTTLITVKGESSTTAEFQHLLNHSSVLSARGITITDKQRYGIICEVASGLAFLHAHGVCVGDISPKNLLYCLTPREAVYFIDCDAMRLNGVSALAQVETPGWEAPAGEEMATVYSDTYKLGLLALRLLAGDQDTANPSHLPASAPGLLRQLITDTLSNLPERRPLPEAWNNVLAHPIEEAQLRANTPSAPVVSSGIPAPQIPVVHSRPRHQQFSQTMSGPAHPRSAPGSSSTGLRLGDLGKVLVADKRYKGRVGRVVSSDSNYVDLKFEGSFGTFSFPRSQVVAVTAPQTLASPIAGTKAAPRFPSTGLRVGGLVKVSVGDKRYKGRIGRVVSSDSNYVELKFEGSFGTFSFPRSQVVAVTAP